MIFPVCRVCDRNDIPEGLLHPLLHSSIHLTAGHVSGAPCVHARTCSTGLCKVPVRCQALCCVSNTKGKKHIKISALL